MIIIRGFVVVLVFSLLLTSCINGVSEKKSRVECPACGSELDALYQKRF